MPTYRFRIDRLDDHFGLPPLRFTYAFEISPEALMDAFGEPTTNEGYETEIEMASVRFAELCAEMMNQVLLRTGDLSIEVNGKHYAQG